MKTYTIAAVPGDGIGHEIIKAGIDVLKSVGDKNNFDLFIPRKVM
jgi:isocitrate/isopropylmalate dehydrogenase